MLIWADDFGRYGTTESLMLDGLYAEVTTGLAWQWTLATANPRTGLKSLRIAGTGLPGQDIEKDSVVRRIFGSAKTEVGVGYAIFVNELPVKEGLGAGSYPGAFVLGQFRDTNNQGQLTVILGTDGSVQLYGGLYMADGVNGIFGQIAAARDLGRSDPCIFATGWNSFAMYAVADAAAGSVEIRVNGVTVLTYSGGATVETANVEYSQFVIGTGFHIDGPFTVFGIVDIADFYAWDSTGAYNNDFPGDNKAYLSLPVSDTATSDWTRSGGANNYALIDDVPPDDAGSFLTSSTPGDQVAVETDDLPIPALAVAAVIGFFRGKKTDAGDCKVKIGVISNGTTEFGDEHILTTGYRYFESVFETDPDTGLPWTSAAVDAAKVIYERTV